MAQSANYLKQQVKKNLRRTPKSVHMNIDVAIDSEGRMYVNGTMCPGRLDAAEVVACLLSRFWNLNEQGNLPR